MKVRILATTGVVMIIAGLILQITQDQQKIINQKEEIKSLNERLDQTLIKLFRTEEENQNLWDNYYMNVTNKEGYEYYE